MFLRFFSYIKKIFTFCLYFGRGKKAIKASASSNQLAAQQTGTNGAIKNDAMFVRHNGRTVLVVMVDLGDVPSWIEYDTALGQFSIVQSGGFVAYLELFLQHEDQEAVKKESRILLVTKVQEQQVMHHLQLVVR
jgi:hypothetical protein